MSWVMSFRKCIKTNRKRSGRKNLHISNNLRIHRFYQVYSVLGAKFLLQYHQIDMEIKVITSDSSKVVVLQNLNDEVFVDNRKYDSDLKMDWAQSETGRKYFTEVLNNPEAICLLAEEENKPVGYLIAIPKDISYRLSKYIEIENMGVSPNFRSKGIGIQLINKCIELAKEYGYQKVYVNTYFENTKAIVFYERCGLKKIDVSLEKDI